MLQCVAGFLSTRALTSIPDTGSSVDSDPYHNRCVVMWHHNLPRAEEHVLGKSKHLDGTEASIMGRGHLGVIRGEI